jgi:hypothetical protein
LIRAGVIAAYLAALLAVDTQVELPGQLALGGLTWLVLLVAARPLPAERRAQVAVVICAATLAELTGSILWGVYSYRLHNLPTFVPPAHGLAFLWRSRARAAYAGVFLVVAALELYGTAIGTWRWAEELPGLGIPDGNPPSGVAAGYVWFDVMALLLAPGLLAAVRRTWLLRRRLVPGTGPA